MLIDQHSPKAVRCATSGVEAPHGHAAFAREHAAREFATILGRHGPLNGLDDRGPEAAVVFKFLGAIPDGYSGLTAGEFVMCALVSILKPAPTTDVID